MKIVFFIFKFKGALKILKKPITYKEPDIQQKFSTQKVPEKLDYIIIGSGMGGLIAASILSKFGKRVVVLEQHSIAGGCLHTFEENGYTFDTGLHYLGYQELFTLLLNLTSAKQVEFNTMLLYDVIKLSDNDSDLFKLEGPSQKYRENFKTHFPEYAKEIDQWIAKVRRGCLLVQFIMLRNIILPKYLYSIATLILKIFFHDLYMKTTLQVLDELGLSKNKKLCALLCSQYGDLATTPDKCPFVIQTAVTDGYWNGSVYPKYGSLDIVKGIVSTIEQCGNAVLTKARVTEFIVENNQIQGVIVAGKYKISCKNVISAIGIPQTIQLLPEKNRWPVNYKDSLSHFYCFLGLKGEGLQLPSYNLWDGICSKDYEFIKKRDEYLDTMDFSKMFTFTSFPQAKMQEKTNKNSAIIIAEAKPEWVMQYRVNEVQRKEGYKEFKQKLQDAFLKNFKKNFPDLFDKIDHISISTPLSNENYLGRYGSYGLEFSMKRTFGNELFGKFTTSVGGLYLSGEDSWMAGVSGAMISGFLVSLKLTNYI